MMIQSLNHNKFYNKIENIRNLEIIKNQQFIIQRLENDLQRKNHKILSSHGA